MAEDALVGADVQGANRLLALLDQRRVRPRSALWLKRSLSQSWRLLIVPASGVDRHEFTEELVWAFASVGRREFGVDIGQVSFVANDDPVVRAVRRLVGPFRDDVVWIADTVLEGVFVHEAAVLRMSE